METPLRSSGVFTQPDGSRVTWQDSNELPFPEVAANVIILFTVVIYESS